MEANHGISITDVRELLSPKVATIGWKGIKLHFDQPLSGSKKSKKPNKDTDAMFG